MASRALSLVPRLVARCAARATVVAAIRPVVIARSFAVAAAGPAEVQVRFLDVRGRVIDATGPLVHAAALCQQRCRVSRKASILIVRIFIVVPSFRCVFIRCGLF